MCGGRPRERDMERGLCRNTQVSSVTPPDTGHVTTVTGAVLIMQWGWKPYFTLTHYQQQVADAHLADTATAFAHFQRLRRHREYHGKMAMTGGIQPLCNLQSQEDQVQARGSVLDGGICI